MPSATEAPAEAGAALVPLDPLPPEIARVIAGYMLVHFEPTRARADVVFTPDLKVYGTTLPRCGLDREGYVDFLRKLYGTVFAQAPNTPVSMTRDGQLVLRWTLSAGPRRVAAGLDYLTLQEGRISRIVGLY